MNGVGRPRPESGLELYARLFMRVSGVVLLFVALGPLAIMHVTNNIEVIDYQFVAQGYTTPFWRTYDLVMLWLAMIHGVNGMYILVDDYIYPPGWQVFSLTSLYVVRLILLALGSLVILTFQPVGTPWGAVLSAAMLCRFARLRIALSKAKGLTVNSAKHPRSFALLGMT